MPAPVPFRLLLDALQGAGLLVHAGGDPETEVRALAHDSRAVTEGACFVAVRGASADGHRFVGDAVARGAAAVLAEAPPEPAPAAWAVVRDGRAALAEAAGAFFGWPSRRLRLLGVTGTNGKTTTTFLLHHALSTLGERTGLVGTVEVRLGETVRPASLTTPDALALNALLAEMVAAGCTACAMEVSSHALAQQRVRGLRFAAAAFTNLSHDHLDYHGSFEAYAAAKALLFEGLDAEALAVVYRDDPAWRRMVAATAARVVTCGREAAPGEAPPDVAYAIEEDTLGGLRLRLDGRVRRFRLAGAFNACNLAVAYAVLTALGYDPEAVLDALAAAPPVPGRLEVLRAPGGRGPVAVVDYAHTPDALENVLRTVRAALPPGGRLTVVFGCGGDRDRAKRPVMGRVAEALADRVVLTSDNPRTEDPEAILRAIAAGMTAPPAATIPDRAEAIRFALAEAGPRDAVVVAGKGHEPYQIVGTETQPFDDRVEVRRALGLADPAPAR